MAAAATTFFGNRGTLTIVGSGTYPASQTLAVLKGVEINVTFEHAELYGMSSILRQDVAKYNARVEVSIKYAKFDPTLTSSTHFPYYILNPTATTSPSGLIEDTNTEKTFTVTALWTPTGSGNAKMQIAVSNVYFESFPMPMPEHDFVVIDLKGYGDNVTITNPA